MEQKKRGGKRAGAGAPKLPADKLKKPRTVYLTDEEWDVCEARWSDGWSRSQFLSGLISQYLYMRSKS